MVASFAPPYAARLLLGGAIASAALLAAPAARAAPGDLDPGFGTGDKLTTTFGARAIDRAEALALGADGSAAVVGTSRGAGDDFAIGRLDPDGDLDGSFSPAGTPGIDILDIDGGSTDQAADVALLPDGSAVVVGVTDANGGDDFAIARFAGDSVGVSIVDFGGDEKVGGVAIDSSGRVVVSGTSGGDFALARFVLNGNALALDQSFDGDGKVLTDFAPGAGTSDDEARDVAIVDSEEIVAVGQSDVGGDSDFALARYTVTGGLDASFDSDGLRTIGAAFSKPNWANAVAAEPDGDVVIVGGGDISVPGDSAFDALIARVAPDGQLDSFGVQGTSFGEWADGEGVSIQADGKIVMAATLGEFGREIGLVRYVADGSPGVFDTGFGTNGHVTRGVWANSRDFAEDVAVQSDGTILTAMTGGQPDGELDDFVVAGNQTNGNRDPSFAVSGSAEVTFAPRYDDRAEETLRQSDGKLLVAGPTWDEGGPDDQNFFLARLLAAGGPDPTFGGGDGVVTTDFGGGAADVAEGLAQLPDGRVAVAGTSDERDGRGGDTDFATAVFEANGDLDTDFDGDGLATTDFGTGSQDGAVDVAAHQDGLVVGGNSDEFGNSDFAMARYQDTGALDPGFGFFGGTTQLGAGLNAEDFAGSLVIAGDRIYMSGTSNGLGDDDFLAARFLPDGTPDPDFPPGGGGFRLIDIGADTVDSAVALAVQPDGRVLLGGRTGAFPDQDFALVRLQTDAQDDMSFSGDGRVVTDFGSTAGIRDLAVAPDGTILAAGEVGDPSDFALARYLPGGAPDPAFGGGDGSTSTDFLNGFDTARSVTLDGGTGAILAGMARSGVNSWIGMARYFLVTPPFNTAPTPPVVGQTPVASPPPTTCKKPKKKKRKKKRKKRKC